MLEHEKDQREGMEAMAFGYVGKILRVHLSTGEIRVEEPDDKFYRTYVGGRNIIAHYLLKETPAAADPWGLTTC